MLGQEQISQFDNKCLLGERIISFRTKNTLKMLANTNTWYTNGNFGLASKNFTQLYFIRVKKKNVFVTAILCLFEKKNTKYL